MMKKNARNMNVNEKIIRNIVKTDLNLSPIKMHFPHQFSDLQEEKSYLQLKIHLNKMKSNMDTEKIIFNYCSMSKHCVFNN